MSEVTLKINNRGYSLSCDPGQEQRIGELGHYVDSRLQDISAAGAATNESHLLVLTSLVLADELFELKDQLAALQAGNPIPQASSALGQDDVMVAKAIDMLASKIETIADRIQCVEDSAAA